MQRQLEKSKIIKAKYNSKKYKNISKVKLQYLKKENIVKVKRWDED